MRIIIAVVCLWLATSALESKIVFYSNRDRNYEIYMMDSDGTNQTRLGFDYGPNSMPVWSPNGRQIAFESYREGNREVYVIDADGKKQRNLTRQPALDAFPSWSPDGSQIVFASARNDGRSGDLNLFVMDSDGGNVRQLTNMEHASRPQWSALDGWILFEGYVNKAQLMQEIYVIHPDGVGLKQISQPTNRHKIFASWSPNGEQILYTETTTFNVDNMFPTIATLDPAGQKVISSELIPIPLKVFQPVAFSADGKSILFSGKKQKRWNIYRLHLHNRKLIRLTNTPFKDVGPNEWNPRLSAPLQGLTPTLLGKIKANK